jgi:hypothetical protein
MTTQDRQAHAGSGAARSEWIAPTVQRGMTLAHRGNDIGVINHVTRNGESSIVVFHAVGGVSRSLEYTVPETAIVGVFGVASRVIVSEDVDFEPRHLCADGRVVLAPRPAREACRSRATDWREMPHPLWVGVRVYADDGYLGVVTAVLSTMRPGNRGLLVVRSRSRFRRHRLVSVPVSRLMAFSPAENVARATGSRRTLADLSAVPPFAA